MAKAYNERCIVLKHTKLGETDAIVTMLASDGSQVRAVAKGLRKPGNRIGARLELFCEADLLLHEGKSLDIVRGQDRRHERGDSRRARTHRERQRRRRTRREART